MKPALLLSDLHLPPRPSPLREAFRRFLDGPAREASAVYLLGDVFEYWVGDDVGLQTYAAEAAALSGLVAAGTPVWFMHGNRDFLVGEAFGRRTGVWLLPDPVVVELGGQPTLLSHGDLFCTGDRAYQRWRRFSRNRLAQRLFLALPKQRRKRIAGGLRGESDIAKHDKPDAILDVSPEALEAAFGRYGVQRLIHGHTHRPALHRLELGGRIRERIVLPDWRPETMDYLAVSGAGVERLPVNARGRPQSGARGFR